MFENFSVQSQKVVNELEKIKINDPNKVIGSEDLLLALIKVPDSIIKYILEEYKVNIENLEQEINNLIIIRKSDNGYTNIFREIIENSEVLAHEEGSKFIYDEHLIYSLLTKDNSLACFILRKHLNNFEQLIDDFANIFDLNSREDDTFLFNLTREAKQGKLGKFIGREELIAKVIRVLQKKQKNNPLLIGSAGVGKSALVEAVAMELYKKYPEYTLYRLDLGTIIAGTKYRGDLEERLIKVINHIKKPYTIVFIDEIHNIISTGSSDGSLDIANILKPVLSRNEIKCIGATTLDEYYSIISRDKALARRFANIFIDEPSIEETSHILKGIRKDYQKHYNVRYPDEVLEYISEKSSMIANRYFPDKAIDVLDEVGLYCKSIKQKQLEFSMVDKIIFDILGLDYKNIKLNLETIKHYPQLKRYYQIYLLSILERPNILSVASPSSVATSLLIEDLEHIFKLKQEMILRLDFSKYLDAHTISNLLGSPKGYVGYDSGGILTEHVLKYPFNVVTINNFDMACLDIKNTFKTILKEGSIIDPKSRKINFRNTIFIIEGFIEGTNIGFINQEQTKQFDFVDEILSNQESDLKYSQKIKLILKRLERYKYFITLNTEITNDADYQYLLQEITNIDNYIPNKKYQIINDQQLKIIDVD